MELTIAELATIVNLETLLKERDYSLGKVQSQIVSFSRKIEKYST